MLYDLATRPALVALLRPLLGENFLLWGASLIVREPAQVHPWHCDIESCNPNGGFVTVWIGIENTSLESALQLIAGSHAIEKTIQQAAHERGLRRGEASVESVVGWAREALPTTQFIQPSMGDGDALFFDGRLWHGSDNTRAQGARRALLFQYAAAGSPVKMIDFAHLEWPFRFKRTRVPVLVVSGSDLSRANKIVPAPRLDGESPLEAEVRPLILPLPEDPAARWKPHDLFAGSTQNVSRMGAHVSVLSSGHSPHPPHAHADEELLIMFDGEADLVILDTADSPAPRLERLCAGSFVYYPAFQFHTIRNPTSVPTTYLMFKWKGAPLEVEDALETASWNPENAGPMVGTGFGTRLIFEGPTNYLRKLHAHLTELQPGAGYEAHTDAHDVAIVLLSGNLQTMGRTVNTNGVIYYPSGQLHDMQNPGKTTARYLVFEFHGEGTPRPVGGSREMATSAGRFARRFGRTLRRRLDGDKESSTAKSLTSPTGSTSFPELRNAALIDRCGGDR
ncbi:MAG: phytanoyl-CoA dioxygenase family protein [Chthoniobacterales bacterium]